MRADRNPPYRTNSHPKKSPPRALPTPMALSNQRITLEVDIRGRSNDPITSKPGTRRNSNHQIANGPIFASLIGSLHIDWKDQKLSQKLVPIRLETSFQCQVLSFYNSSSALISLLIDLHILHTVVLMDEVS